MPALPSLVIGHNADSCSACRAELTDTVGLQPALPGMGRTGYDLAEKARAQRLEHAHQSPNAPTPARAVGQSPLAGPRAEGRSPRATLNSPRSGFAGNSPRPVAEGTEDPHVELSRFSYAASIESCDVYGAPAPMLISRYERNPPPEIVEGKPGQPVHINVHDDSYCSSSWECCGFGAQHMQLAQISQLSPCLAQCSSSFAPF